jgi:hypothetical protein
MRKTLSFLLLLLPLGLACASGKVTRPEGMPAPDITAQLVNPLFFGSGTTAAANIEIRVTNRGNAPLVVRRIELESPGMSQFTLGRYVREHNETVPPGETKAITAFATAYAQTTRRPTEPLTIRAIVQLQSGGKSWREIAILRQTM